MSVSLFTFALMPYEFGLHNIVCVWATRVYMFCSLCFRITFWLSIVRFTESYTHYMVASLSLFIEKYNVNWQSIISFVNRMKWKTSMKKIIITTTRNLLGLFWLIRGWPFSCVILKTKRKLRETQKQISRILECVSTWNKRHQHPCP